MKVLHVLEASIPHVDGYTIRARYIIDFQQRAGMEPVVVTSPLFPTRDPSIREEEFDGVRYHRTNHIPAPASARSKLVSYAVRADMLRRYRRAVLDVARRERPDVLHAHSSYANAQAGYYAARRLGLPLIYEVRTLWGESAVVEDGWRRNSWKHRIVWNLELKAMRRAQLVVPIAKGIRDELVSRGIDAAKLEVVPNGVDSAKFVPRARDEQRARQAGVAGRFVVGFIGSIRKLEGLSTLLRAYELCRRRGNKMAVVIVGDGPDRRRLQEEAARSGLDVIFTGNVPHGEVASWYSIMDVLVYPRIRAVINERVTPLKPLEAMALGKVCVASDVGGLTELVHDDDTGVVFRSEDATDLADALGGLMNDPDRMNRLRDSALRYAREVRDWRLIVPRYADLYERVVANRIEPARRSVTALADGH